MTAPAAPTRRPIRVLAPEVAARIAAGEVIERPASVVRELLDNAIDAGAGRITVEIEEGGLALIRLADDGRGIAPGDLELAFERHATSKIDALDDLAGIRTLGFRGEALPSIAAAADIEITSRAAGEPLGVQAILADAAVVRRAARPAPVGTSIAVRDLFGRLPARRKFLGTPAAEARRITTLVAHYALAYPGIAFAFSSAGRRLLVTSGDGSLRHAFAAVYGADTAATMLEVGYTTPEAAVTGLAGPSSVHRGNRSAISIFVNGRWVQSRTLIYAAADAYEAQLPVGRHPVAALELTVPATEVDVNVHPAKAEVRFRDERAVARAVRHAVLAALEGARPVAWAAPPAVALSPRGETGPLAGPARTPVPGMAAALLPPAPLQGALRWQPDAAARRGPTQREVLPLLRVVGQLASSYIVAEGPDGMYLVDQHAAHERVHYDRIVAARAGAQEANRQQLLEPELLELDPVQAATLAEFAAHLESLGLTLEPFGERATLVRAVPAGLPGAAGLAVAALLDRLHEERRLADPFARAAASVACHSAVRAGTALALDAMRALVDELARTESPRTCPHGRPTLLHMSTPAIERQFGRR